MKLKRYKNFIVESKEEYKKWLEENLFYKDEIGYSTNENIDLNYDDSILKYGCIQLQLNIVKGHFYADDCNLNTLYNFPKIIDGGFFADNNKSLSLYEKQWYYKRACIDKIGYNNYWMDLLNDLVKDKKFGKADINWPKGFLTNEVIRSAKGISKFNL